MSCPAPAPDFLDHDLDSVDSLEQPVFLLIVGSFKSPLEGIVRTDEFKKDRILIVQNELEVTAAQGAVPDHRRDGRCARGSCGPPFRREDRRSARSCCLL